MICPVCTAKESYFFANAQDWEYRTSDQSYAYHRCKECRAIFLPNPPIHALQKIYPSNYYSYQPGNNDGLLQRLKNWLDGRLFRKILRDIPGANLKTLDVGGGCGWLSSIIAQQDKRISATHVLDVDASAKDAAVAAGHQFHCSRAEEFTSDESFDLMVLLNIVEHLADPGQTLRNLRRFISPRGMLLLKTPNTDTPDCRLFHRHLWGGFHTPRHWVLFDRENLTLLAERNGWKVRWTDYTQGAAQMASTLLCNLAARRWISITAERPIYMHPLWTPALAGMAVIDLLRRPFLKPSQMFMLLAPDITIH